jgi:hypothetical protein
VPELRRLVEQHVEAIAQASEVNEFVDIAGAHALSRQCALLFDRWESLSLPDRHLAHAAIQYFVSWDDVTNDLDIGGLDDDKQIMNAVLSYLSLEEPLNGHP